MPYKPNYTLLATCAIIATVGIWLGLSLAYDNITPKPTVYEDYSIQYGVYSTPSVKGY